MRTIGSRSSRCPSRSRTRWRSTNSAPTSSANASGLEPTGDAFNAISLDPVTGQATNAMVNAGAITAADLIHVAARRRGARSPARRLLEVRRATARRRPEPSPTPSVGPVTATGRSLICCAAPGSMGDDVETSLDLYFNQCSVAVDCHDLGVIAATLANGGRNPIDGTRRGHPTHRAPGARGDVELRDVRRGRPLDRVGRPARQERRQRRDHRRAARPARRRRVLAAARPAGQQRPRRQRVPRPRRRRWACTS